MRIFLIEESKSKCCNATIIMMSFSGEKHIIVDEVGRMDR